MKIIFEAKQGLCNIETYELRIRIKEYTKDYAAQGKYLKTDLMCDSILDVIFEEMKNKLKEELKGDQS